MTGNEYIKQKRIENHLSIRGLAMSCDIAPRMVSYYEKGEKLLSAMPVNKALRYFDAIGCDIKPFFSFFYPYSSELDSKLSAWAVEHPRCYDTLVLKKKYYLRLAKLKERKRISGKLYDSLMHDYQMIFNKELNGKTSISDEEYRYYILPFNAKLRGMLYALSDNNRIAKQIRISICNTEYSMTDMADFCDITGDHLKRCLDNDARISKMHVISVLKLCYVLGFDFDKVFIGIK